MSNQLSLQSNSSLLKLTESALTVSSGTFVPTHEFKSLLSQNNRAQVLDLMTRMMAKVFLASQLENVISSKETLCLIASEILDSYPCMQIGEFAVLLRKGVTGHYGPLYGKISIDSVGQWVKKYYEITWPEIERKATQKQIQHNVLAETQSIPMPDFVKNSLATIIKKKDTKPYEPPKLSTEEVSNVGNPALSSVFLFLDDIQDPKQVFDYTQKQIFITQKWEIVRSFEEFKSHIETNGLPAFISFDHDLADTQDQKVQKEKTGYDCAIWLFDHCITYKLKLPEYYCHSMNTVGKDKILWLFRSFEKLFQKV
jgi:hypothetical protein